MNISLWTIVIFSLIGLLFIRLKKLKVRYIGKIYLKGYSIIGTEEWLRTAFIFILLVLVFLLSYLSRDYVHTFIVIGIFIFFNLISPSNYYLGEKGIAKSLYIPFTPLNVNAFTENEIEKIETIEKKFGMLVVITLHKKNRKCMIYIKRNKCKYLNKWLENISRHIHFYTAH